MSSLTLRGIQKSFSGTRVLHGIDLDVADGEFIVFVGPSGCGKSTMLRCIAGLEEPEAGDVLIDGRRMNDVPPAQRGVAMVFQSYALYPHMTVAENMSFGLRMIGMKKPDIERTVAHAAEVLQITPLLQRRPAQLSGGQRQRVAIGRAIVRRPGVFLFDEPLSNLDAALRTQMRVEMARLHASLKATIVYVTHDQAEAMTLADRIVVFNAGRIEQVGAPLSLYRRPAGLFVAGFLGSPRINLLPATVSSVEPARVWLRVGDAEAVDVQIDAPRVRAGDRVTLGVRPEHFILLGDDEPARPALRGRVQLVEHLGDVAYVHALAEHGETLTARMPHDTPLQAGATVRLAFPPAEALLFDADGRAVRPPDTSA
jgi:multiple sugar transport system ATP-binding protein